ncbi:MAG: DUF3263 domain-containing protein [Acidimicrobiia bacterium]|nr:DUF3263 domain-containing protein [Acidimicrobiia bacterium]MYC57621.1 DUF3263 domain-containing protein [Acidimicrobiia bacterium]MYG94911.1 DUF3263 domain-containing protein [Acidimicrobiia bacterium]MYI31248.1 DUF3263 domain-containing protein [Acidimicrobiia bacterium]
MALTKRDQQILDFERTWWQETGSKEAAIRERFELSTTRYYQLLNDLLADADAMKYDPMVVRRLLRMRDNRRRSKYGETSASWQPSR